MINWIKYDPENPPAKYTPFIVFSGQHAYISFGQLEADRWVEMYEREQPIWDVTHYAPINLPGEETTE